ncbi:GTP cyclohydrolase 1 [Geodia barretti]|uniref:GTP cyclohydrolase 1 n=1 Tax=Geodia barretti TaxID=519541 RepID=A0AA35WWH8_GEOBA|nr:GTP cyclohydrolase 1 [Geodia barretti]
MSRIQEAVADILEAIGEDPRRDGLERTPIRVAKMYESLFSGVGVRAEDAIDAVFEVGGNDPVVLNRLAFYSVCEHHLMPFFGEASIGYIPGNRIAGVGVSKHSWPGNWRLTRVRAPAGAGEIDG